MHIIYIYIYIYIYVHIYIYTHTYIYIYIHMYITSAFVQLQPGSTRRGCLFVCLFVCLAEPAFANDKRAPSKCPHGS